MHPLSGTARIIPKFNILKSNCTVALRLLLTHQTSQVFRLERIAWQCLGGGHQSLFGGRLLFQRQESVRQRRNSRYGSRKSSGCFRYKEELDPEKIPQLGLIAEEVEKVNPDLVARDEEGKIMSVRYEAVNAMLLNEFLKEHQKVQELEANAARQQR